MVCGETEMSESNSTGVSMTEQSTTTWIGVTGSRSEIWFLMRILNRMKQVKL